MFNRIRRFIERGRKGYCYEDIWQFENWLSKLIAGGLREFKQNCCTYPGDDMTWEEWMGILDEMVECFEEQSRKIDNIHRDKDFMELYHKRDEERKKKLHRGLFLLEKYYYDLWD